jgi:hypothetical protein
MSEDSFELRTDLTADEWRMRVDKALEVIVQYGGTDGSHHKTWTLDQAVRALTGCPLVWRHEIAKDGVEPYALDGEQGESEEYTRLVAWACDGENGPETYSWDTGIAP